MIRRLAALLALTDGLVTVGAVLAWAVGRFTAGLAGALAAAGRALAAAVVLLALALAALARAGAGTAAAAAVPLPRGTLTAGRTPGLTLSLSIGYARVGRR